MGKSGLHDAISEEVVKGWGSGGEFLLVEALMTCVGKLEVERWECSGL